MRTANAHSHILQRLHLINKPPYIIYNVEYLFIQFYIHPCWAHINSLQSD